MKLFSSTALLLFAALWTDLAQGNVRLALKDAEMRFHWLSKARCDAALGKRMTGTWARSCGLNFESAEVAA